MTVHLPGSASPTAMASASPRQPGNPQAPRLCSAALATWILAAAIRGEPEVVETVSRLAWKLVPLGAPSSSGRYRLVDAICNSTDDPELGLLACRESLDRALELRHRDDPFTTLAHLTLARTHLEAGRWEEASEMIDRSLVGTAEGGRSKLAVMDRFHRGLAFYLRGQLLEARGDEVRSRRDYVRSRDFFASLSVDQTVLFPLHFYALSLLRLGELDQARPLLRRLLERGWWHRDVLGPAESLGALPDPMPPKPATDLEPPAALVRFVESLEAGDAGVDGTRAPAAGLQSNP